MKNEIKYKGYTIFRWVAAFNGDEIVGEYDSMVEAKRHWKFGSGVRFRYAAAEQINDNGDVNPAVYADTLQEVTLKIKKLLST